MKKIIIALFVLFGVAKANSQVTFKPGVRAGVNFSHFTDGDYQGNSFFVDPNSNMAYRIPPTEYKSKTDFYVGIYGALKLTRFYTLQPEITYSRQGSKIESYRQVNGVLAKNSVQIDLSYVSVALINKFTFNNRFSMFIGPTVDVLADQSGGFSEPYALNAVDPYYYYSNDYIYDTDSDIDLAFVFGLGVNLTKNLGLEARIKKGIIPVLDWSGDNHTNVVFSAGLTYTFDVSGAGSTN